MPSLQSILSALFLLTLTAFAANEVVYCSSQNTGAPHNTGENIFNSIGACRNKCSGFDFAVVQGRGCWCSNSMPTSGLQAISDCSTVCPGYPVQGCGNTDAGLFGYVMDGDEITTTQMATATMTGSTISVSRTSSMVTGNMTMASSVPRVSVNSTSVVSTTTSRASSSTASTAPASFTGAAAEKLGASFVFGLVALALAI